MACYMMKTINPREVEKKRQHIEWRITELRRQALVKNLIASAMDGAYVTKKLEPKLLEVIRGAGARLPEITRVFITTSYNKVYLHIHYKLDNGDWDQIFLCDANDRRLNGAKLLEASLNDEQRAAEYVSKLDHLDAAVAAYNRLAQEYAVIHESLDDILDDDIPSPDWELRRAVKNAHSPESFMQTIAKGA